MKAKLTMLIGVSGVGKSTFAKQLKDAGEIDLIISSDVNHIGIGVPNSGAA